uniref:Variant surface glycoprotein 1125.392 n=1 Tax=Trypanosoma brucei TaxID=5691 RepID=A0A1J0R5T2_9TRYP|nr:variant surface glycoprotein 1125.392 [Trypanosoma brucei]
MKRTYATLIEFLVTYVASANQDTAGREVKSACTEARYAKPLEEKLSTMVKNLRQDQAALQTAKQAYELAVANFCETPKKIAFTAMSALAARRLSSAATDVEAATQEYLEAQRFLNMRQATLVTITRNTVKGSKADKDSAPTGSGGSYNSGKQCDAVHTLVLDTTNNCTLEGSDVEQITSANTDLTSIKKLKMATGEATALQKLTIRALATGTEASLAHASTATHGFCTTTAATALVSATDLLGTTVTAQPRTDAAEEIDLHDGNKETECKEHDSSKAWQEYTPTALAAAICKAKNTRLPNLVEPHKEKLMTLEQDETIAQAITDMASPGKEAPPAGEERKKLIHTYLGKTEDGYQQGFVKDLTVNKIDITIREKPIRQTPLEIATSGEASTVLPYLFGKHLSSKPIKQTTTTSVPHTKEISDKDKCKTDDGCELKDEKCIAQVEETGKDDKTTNTTGSNSFVIKAPLLLAFLRL